MKMIYDWARKQAQQQPDSIAITSNRRHVSYSTLESESNRLASLLLVSNLKDGDRVCLLLGTNPENIIAMHGTNKAGGVNVPVNTDLSVDELAKILKKAAPSFFMINHNTLKKYQELIQRYKEFESIPWIWWSPEICKSQDQYTPIFSYNDIWHQPNLAYDEVKDETSAAVIYFKNGESGESRGVVLSHKNISTYINWAVNYFDIKGSDRLTGDSPAHSNLSCMDMYSTFAAGAHLYIAPPETRGIPDDMSKYILENDITQWFADSSVLNYIAHFDQIQDIGFPGLERVLWHGKRLPVTALKYWMENLPHVTFTNLYGPAESAIACGYYSVPEIPVLGDEIPIGKPCAGRKMYVLSERLKSVPPGEIGDLYITGEGISEGYWNEKENNDLNYIWFRNTSGKWERLYKTGDLASQNTDGLVYYHGKSNFKIKKSDQHLQYEDVEAALSNFNFLKEYAVVPVEKGEEEPELGCAYVSGPEMEDEVPPVFKNELLKYLPSRLMPTQWKAFDKLPRKSNGKIDRETLSEEFKS